MAMLPVRAAAPARVSSSVVTRPRALACMAPPRGPAAAAGARRVEARCNAVLARAWNGMECNASAVCTTGTGLFDVANGSKWFMAQPKKRHSKTVRRRRRAIWLKKADRTAERAYSLGRSVLSGKNKSFLYNTNVDEEDDDLDALDDEEEEEEEEEDPPAPQQ